MSAPSERSRSGAPLPVPDPPLVDRELVLRPWAVGDAPVLVAAWADPEVARWTGVPAARGLAAAERWIAGDAARRQRGLSLDLVIALTTPTPNPTSSGPISYPQAVIVPGQNSWGGVVGEVGLTGFDLATGEAEVGWWLAAEHRGAGYASRAVSMLTDWAVQELAVDRLVARCHQANPASGAVARRAGFVGPEPAPGQVEVWRSA